MSTFSHAWLLTQITFEISIGLNNSLTSADTATASNQWSQFRARNTGLNRVSKFDTTANLTPAFLIALNTFSASGSQRCHAFQRLTKKQGKLIELSVIMLALQKFTKRKGNHDHFTFSVV